MGSGLQGLMYRGWVFWVPVQEVYTVVYGKPNHAGRMLRMTSVSWSLFWGEFPKGPYLGYCPHPVTVYIRGPIKGYIYITISYLLSNCYWGGGSTQPIPF